MRNCLTNAKYNKTQNNLFEHKTDGLAFKLLVLIIVKQLFIFNFKLTFVLLYPSWLQNTSNWNELKKKTSMFECKTNGFWDQNVMLDINVWKEGSTLSCHLWKLKYFTLNNPDVQDPSWDSKKRVFVWIQNTRFCGTQDGHVLMSLWSWVKIYVSNKI